MEQQELVFAQDGFDELKSKVDTGYDLMEAYYNAALDLKKAIEGSSWKGKQRTECCAFFDLVLQFHKALLEEPLETNRTIVRDMDAKVTDFLEGCGLYNNL